MEGVPTNALAEWKARKEAEAGSAALAAASAARRPRNSYPVIPEADLMTALSQHKMLMATRNNPIRQMAFPPFPPGSAPPFAPGMPPPTSVMFEHYSTENVDSSQLPFRLPYASPDTPTGTFCTRSRSVSSGMLHH